MSTVTSQIELQAFYDFLGRQISEGTQMTPEESLREFQAYQEELRRVQAELSVSHQEFLKGEAKPLDEKALLARVHARIPAKRIPLVS